MASLSLVSNVPGWSSFNPIEAKWGPLTKAIAYKCLGATEEGFGDLLGEELYRKACKIALEQAEEIWCGNTTKTGCKITVTTHLVAPDAVPQNEADEEDPSPLHVVYDSKTPLEKVVFHPRVDGVHCCMSRAP